MLCRSKSSVKVDGDSVPVYLNIYDLLSANGCASKVGLGAYHSGVQVRGVEYAYGAGKHATSGIFVGEPKKCEGYKFKKTIFIGCTRLTEEEVKKVMKELSKENAYNIFNKNCNHFCNDACIRLTGNPIPSWVNRLARAVVICNCLLPMPKNQKQEETEEETKHRRSSSKRSSSSSSPSSSSSSKSSSSSSSPPNNTVPTFRRSGSVLPSTSMRFSSLKCSK